MTSSAPSVCTSWTVRVVAAMAVAVVITEAWRCSPSGEHLRAASAHPTKLHGSSGWGRPAVDDRTVYYLSKRHELFAVDRHSGIERWRRSLGTASGVTAGTHVVRVRSVVIVGDGDVFAFDAQSGNSRWRLGQEVVHDPGRFVGAVVPTPIVEPDLSMLGRSRVADAPLPSAGPKEVDGNLEGSIAIGSSSGTCTFVNPETGAQRGQVTVGGSRTIVFGPVADDDLVVAGFTDVTVSPRVGGIVAVTTHDSHVLWRAEFPRAVPELASGAAGPPVLVGSLIYAAASDGTIYGLERATGRVRKRVPAVPFVEPAVGNDPTRSRGIQPSLGGRPRARAHEDFRVIASLPPLLVITSLTGRLTAVAADTLQERWIYSSPPNGSNGFGVATHGSLLYLPFASGRLALVDLRTGTEVTTWGGPTQRFDWAPVVAGRQGYLTAEDGLYVFDTPTI